MRNHFLLPLSNIIKIFPFRSKEAIVQVRMNRGLHLKRQKCTSHLHTGVLLRWIKSHCLARLFSILNWFLNKAKCMRLFSNVSFMIWTVSHGNRNAFWWLIQKLRHFQLDCYSCKSENMFCHRFYFGICIINEFPNSNRIHLVCFLLN